MNFNFKKKSFIFKHFKIFLTVFFSLVIFIEILFQTLSFTDNSLIKKPILFFNPYCDQEYWDNNKKLDFNKNVYKYHPILSLIKNKHNIPTKENSNIIKKNKNDLPVFYGSSFVDHKNFVKSFSKVKNYAVKSYGLDQIYLSYTLTKHEHYGDLIVVGFLLEDLDRIIFKNRNYNKIKYKKVNNEFLLENYPVDLLKFEKKKINFYSYNFFKSLIFLFNNDFDYKKSTCQIDFKKDFFQYFIEKIKKQIKLNNQKLIIVTFNFKEDIGSNDNWRYEFINKILKEQNILHVDSKKLIELDMMINNYPVNRYYSKQDLHYNEMGHEVVFRELTKFIELYR